MIADAFALVSFCAAVIRAGQLVLIVYEGTALRFLLFGWRIGRDRSQLAIEYAHHVREQSLETRVIWLHASGVARFEQGVRSTLDQLKVPGRSDPKANILQLL
ncbi:hypothetical protein B0A54_18019 [Friedmanniomyces endolithicus]|uniref:Uncharacterized protein n=1 Tax=Friedmanniomyces endolithicus TaxID=329885 RepID=A0A4U0TQA2_9PEZI|nr:hypothetical protein B0A54_18019 [Friedmanniomyces endolithicus]